MRIIIAVVIVGLAGFLAYSFFMKKEKPVKTGVVYFYPKANVYYNVASGEYVYFDEQLKKWNQSEDFSEEQKLSLGEKAIIQKPADPIWKNNAEDRIIYSVNVYASSNELKEKFRTDSLNSLPKKTTKTPAKKVDSAAKEEADKEKSGIRKFFDKLFGGKKQNEQDLENQ